MKFLITRLFTLKGLREHIIKIRDIVAQLRDLVVDMSDYFLVHYIINSLPPPYGPFRISYNTHKDNWSINELMTMCVQEEEMLVMETSEDVLMTTVGKNVNQANKNGK